MRAAAVAGDESGGDERAYSAANAVAAVEAAEGLRRMGEVGAEDVVERQIQRHAQAGKEERAHDEGEWRLTHEQDVGERHEGLGQHESFGAAETR